MQKSLFLFVALCAMASAAPSNFNNDVILGRRGSVAAVCSCQSTKCTTPAPVNGAAGTCTGELADGASCTPTCNTGYVLSGIKHTCTKGYLSQATCVPIPCVAITTNPTNGNAGGCNVVIARGATCTQACNAGFSLTAGGKFTCPTSGSATGTTGVCSADCKAQTSNITNGQVGTCGTATKATKTCQQTCNAGYSIATGSGKYTCGTNGALSGTAATCNKHCPADTATPTNGNKGTCNTAIKYGSSCKQACNAGFTKTAGGDKTCSTAGAALAGTGATCGANCPKQTAAPTNGAVGTCGATNGVEIGKTCKQTCNAGFTKTANGEFSCSAAGAALTGTAATCGANCPKQTAAPTNGVVGTCGATNGVEIGKTCKQTCNAGYHLTANGEFSCSAAGAALTGTAATCVKKCAALTAAVANGVQNTCGAQGIPGATCTQKCNAGYTLSGGSYTCPTSGANVGTWQGTAATCTKKATPTPTPCTVTDCAAGGTNMANGASCTPTCKAGTTVIGVATCKSDGNAVCTPGCASSCASGNSCIVAGSASACTACKDGLTLLANNGMSYGQCLWGGGTTVASIAQTITIKGAALTAAAYKDNVKKSYEAGYLRFLGGTTAAGSKCSSAISSRRADTSINFAATIVAKEAAAAYTKATTKSVADFVAAFNAAKLAGVAALAAVNVAKIATPTVSSASSTAITGMLAMVVAVWGWTQH